MRATVVTRTGRTLETPAFIEFVFTDKRVSILWLAIRVWLGLQWIESGLGKLKNPAWVQTGAALKGFWTAAVQVPAEGRPPIAYDWYRSFLQGMLDSGAYTWFAKLIVAGELLIGISLILGLFIGIAALLGGFMNWNFIMAGSASVNGYFLLLSILLILAWKTAGYLGADYFLLPRLGDLWSAQKK